MPFDARTVAKAREPSSFIDRDGVTHTGRILSYPEYCNLLPAFRAWTAAELGPETPEQVRALLRGLGFDAEAVERFLELPPDVMEDGLVDFFARQRRPGSAAGTSMPASPTPGSPTA